MERKGTTYTIYKITSPSGKCYIGYTSMTLNERWRHHKRRAYSKESPDHPFYNEIREYAPEQFILEVLATTANRLSALALEERYISETPYEVSLNLSAGGLNDAKEGGRIFWERINANPESRKAYLKKLSEVKKSDDWTDYEKLKTACEDWRKCNPREAYAFAYRAVRIANRKMNHAAPCELKTDTRPLKDRLMHKYKLNEIKRQRVTEVWANRNEEDRAVIANKISATAKSRMAELSIEERRQITTNARASIDRDKQGKAASAGLKKWWTDLKADPERYEAYITARTRALKEGKTGK